MTTTTERDEAAAIREIRAIQALRIVIQRMDTRRVQPTTRIGYKPRPQAKVAE